MFGFGLTVAGIGMGIVFLELILLIFVIYLISSGAARINGIKSPKSVKPVQGKAEPAPVAVSQSEQAANDNEEVLAVIAAAIACFDSNVRISTISRIKGADSPVWSHAGRHDVMSARQI